MGLGAYLVVPASALVVPPDCIERNAIAAALVTRKFEDTSSTKLEVQTVLWALANYSTALEEADRVEPHDLKVYTDSQCVVGLAQRRAKLESNEFTSRRTGRPLNHASLYRRFYERNDRLGFEIIKVAGHTQFNTHDTTQRIFSFVDKEVRKRLLGELGSLREATQ